MASRTIQESSRLVQEDLRLLDRDLEEIKPLMFVRCESIRCLEAAADKGLTDNYLTKHDFLLNDVSGALIPDDVYTKIAQLDVSSAWSASGVTLRKIWLWNKRYPAKSLHIRFECCECKRRERSLSLTGTTELLNIDTRLIVCHDKNLPLWYNADRANPDIPDDANYCCKLAHDLDRNAMSQRVKKCIQQSLEKDGVLWRKLEEKKSSALAMFGDPHLSYLRIGVGLQKLDKMTAVLELWPVGHKSPKHQHGGCAGSIRLLEGQLILEMFQSLESSNPILPPQTVSAPKTTWLNRQNWFCHQVSCPRGPSNPFGFAASLHVYKSCVTQFDFVAKDKYSKGNPLNDFFWNIDLEPADLRLMEQTPSFNDLVLKSNEQEGPMTLSTVEIADSSVQTQRRPTSPSLNFEHDEISNYGSVFEDGWEIFHKAQQMSDSWLE